MSTKPVSRVLVVDDELDTVQTTVALLQAFGHSCLGVTTTGEAYRLCHKERFDCVLLDAQFDRTSGLALAERLSASPMRPTKLVIVSAHPLENFMVPLRNGLIDGYLQKPVDPERLNAMISPSPARGVPRSK